MYQKLLRPILFKFDPEVIHHVVSRMLKVVMPLPLIGALIRRYHTVSDPRLEREVFGIRFPNPVGMAAGFDKKANLYNHLRGLGFGYVEIGTVTPVGQPGNPKPRLFRLPKDQALINRMGFNNQGVESFVRNLKKNHPKIIIGGNIGKNTHTPQEKAVDDYCTCFSALFDHVDYFVVNVSCPNIAGLTRMQDQDQLVGLLSAIQELNQKKANPKPVLLKIAPDLNDKQLDEVVEIVRQTRLDGIIATNTTTSRENLATSEQTVENIGRGGLSGKPIRDTSTRVISYLHRKSGGSIPIIGVGGIMTPQDALEKLHAGATLVQVYTGFIYSGPSLVKKINKAILKSL